jgi:hypothetical protein
LLNSGHISKRLLERFDGCLRRYFLPPPVIIGRSNCVIIKLAYEVVLGVIRAKLGLIIFHVIDPLDLGLPVLREAMASEIGQRTHLGIHEGIPKNELLTLEHLRAAHLGLMRDLVPFLGDGWSISLALKACLICRELMNEGSADLQIGSPAIKELQGLQE